MDETIFSEYTYLAPENLVIVGAVGVAFTALGYSMRFQKTSKLADWQRDTSENGPSDEEKDRVHAIPDVEFIRSGTALLFAISLILISTILPRVDEAWEYGDVVRIVRVRVFTLGVLMVIWTFTTAACTNLWWCFKWGLLKRGVQNRKQ